MSPRWKAGSMLPLSTTTTGLSDSVITIRLFQIMSAEHTIIARLSTWCASWRLRMSRTSTPNYTHLATPIDGHAYRAASVRPDVKLQAEVLGCMWDGVRVSCKGVHDDGWCGGAWGTGSRMAEER